MFVFFQDLDLHDILAETEKRGISFDQLLTIPEQDDWVYSDGKSTTCVAFILAMYKEAGIFGPISDSIQVTEFTVSRNPVTLNLFILLGWVNHILGLFPIILIVYDIGFIACCRFVMLICLRFMRITRHAYQSGATMRMDGSHSARFLVNTGWNCLSITH